MVSNKLTYKLRRDLLINEHGKLEPTAIELIFPNKKNIICDAIYKHPVMKICEFNNEYLTPLRAKILQEEKTYVLMDDFNINLINTDTDYNVSDFYDILSSKFFAPYILQPTRLTKNSKTLIDVFLNSIEFNTFSGNLTSQILDHLPQFLTLKDFYHKTFINSN